MLSWTLSATMMLLLLMLSLSSVSALMVLMSKMLGHLLVERAQVVETKAAVAREAVVMVLAQW